MVLTKIVWVENCLHYLRQNISNKEITSYLLGAEIISNTCFLMYLTRHQWRLFKSFHNFSSNLEPFLLNAVRSQMVDEVLEDVHHAGFDVMERHGVIRAADRAVLCIVSHQFQVPVACVDFGISCWQVVELQWCQWEETATTKHVSTLQQLHAHILQTFAWKISFRFRRREGNESH